jgi:hypothetical protein
MRAKTSLMIALLALFSVLPFAAGECLDVCYGVFNPYYGYCSSPGCTACATEPGQTVVCTSDTCWATCAVYNSDGAVAYQTFVTCNVTATIVYPGYHPCFGGWIF